MKGPVMRNGLTAVKLLKNRSLSEFLSPLPGQSAPPLVGTAKALAACRGSAHVHRLGRCLPVLFLRVWWAGLTDQARPKGNDSSFVALNLKIMASITMQLNSPLIHHYPLQHVPQSDRRLVSEASRRGHARRVASSATAVELDQNLLPLPMNPNL
ncbi:conserved hypothetical protein [Neospora caninum Liverpool]|uniref:Uncharacterized protein n=1 Tax=Neospora caninum (strain Liverpool) TaxID=572307 RepID=F0VKR6_NEOCL|nr:conserved hypothetical protein [Neospora caninum Liverpool]CBZ54667.1 conserved hypothetical protein [Neospora caninum Liverpool]|eukprot:XP_003884697.1 conserved hypothetical protein [Neospora caninum Liverpool]